MRIRIRKTVDFYKSGYRCVAVFWASSTTLLGLIGCATPSIDVKPARVPIARYEAFNCQGLRAESQRLSVMAKEVAKIQDESHQSDAAAFAGGFLLTPLFLAGRLGDSANQAELSRLKGEYEAITQVAKNKNCDGLP